MRVVKKANPATTYRNRKWELVFPSILDKRLVNASLKTPLSLHKTTRWHVCQRAPLSVQYGFFDDGVVVNPDDVPSSYNPKKFVWIFP